MIAPPSKPDVSERILAKEEVEKLDFTPKARSIASEYEGIVNGSELVSSDARFGYIYRYDIVFKLNDENDTNKTLAYKSLWVLVLYSPDGKRYGMWLYPRKSGIEVKGSEVK